MENPAKLWKIGELAAKTGLTVRTLHHYETIGLLSPSHRTLSNHRLYDAGDVERLQRILSLKQLGFSLDQIKQSLEKPEFDLVTVLRMQREKARSQLTSMQQLEERLDGLVRFAQSGAPAAEDLLHAMELMSQIESMWTPQELKHIHAQGRKIGREGIVNAEQEWPTLIAAMEAHRVRGTDVSDPDVQKLARRWRELVNAFTGGDPKIAAKLRAMHEKEPERMRQFGGPSPELSVYVERAMRTLD